MTLSMPTPLLLPESSIHINLTWMMSAAGSGFWISSGGHYYVVYGETYNARHPFLHLRPLEFSNEAALDTGIELPTVLDITVDTANGISYDLPEVYEKAGVTLKVANDFVVVNSTDNLLAMYSFTRRNNISSKAVHSPRRNMCPGSRVIVIPELMAARLEKTVGDEIDLSFVPPDSSGSRPYYWAGNGVTNQPALRLSASVILSAIRNGMSIFLKQSVRHLLLPPLDIRLVRRL